MQTPPIELILLRALSWLPLGANHKLGAALGWLYVKLSKRNLHVIQRNLELCLPHKDHTSRSLLAKQNLIETGKNVTELAPFWLWSEEKVMALVVEEVNKHFLEEAKAQGRGVILATPHFGAWELCGLVVSAREQMHYMFRPNRKAHLNAPMLKARERFGAKCYPTNARGIAGLVRALKKGEMIGILPDQEPAEEHGVFTPLFNVPAYTMTFMTNLTHKTNATVLFLAAERLPKAAGYRIHYIKPDAEIFDKDPLLATAALNRCVESCIAIQPAQYMWNYKRFRKVPPGAEPRY